MPKKTQAHTDTQWHTLTHSYSGKDKINFQAGKKHPSWTIAQRLHFGKEEAGTTGSA